MSRAELDELLKSRRTDTVSFLLPIFRKTGLKRSKEIMDIEVARKFVVNNFIKNFEKYRENRDRPKERW